MTFGSEVVDEPNQFALVMIGNAQTSVGAKELLVITKWVEEFTSTGMETNPSAVVVMHRATRGEVVEWGEILTIGGGVNGDCPTQPKGAMGAGSPVEKPYIEGIVLTRTPVEKLALVIEYLQLLFTRSKDEV